MFRRQRKQEKLRAAYPHAN